ncbi:hypothetical protein PPERSA_11015 [Pseudocohnilembus persalinus]|uniref:Uncharacterized protein n=1 Tax=Pseudocohnilembus persalinus TaxID=266149 RepID=A0A0V0QZI3_PSEPJ|nr:hypothetical protein PPERSA_11015 [Pseudocohnilembus persalinus]|eukprot:KRX07466.1 hypothetical protein PPERSA_11015 [Pseudocohnilembus persalinus]
MRNFCQKVNYFQNLLLFDGFLVNEQLQLFDFYGKFYRNLKRENFLPKIEDFKIEVEKFFITLKEREKNQQIIKLLKIIFNDQEKSFFWINKLKMEIFVDIKFLENCAFVLGIGNILQNEIDVNYGKELNYLESLKLYFDFVRNIDIREKI